MLEAHYLHKPLHLINVCKIDNKPSGMVTTELLEVALINTETGGLIESKDIIEKLLNSDSKIKNHVIDDLTLHLKHTYRYVGYSAFGWITRLFGVKKEGGVKTENEFFLVINNPLWVPILIKSIVVETPNFPEVDPSFKNIWTIPLNDNTEALIKHLYKRIKDKDCLNTDMVLVQPIDWKVGKLTDVKRD